MLLKALEAKGCKEIFSGEKFFCKTWVYAVIFF